MKHVHADLIIEWANGAKIERYYIMEDKWVRDDNPQWWSSSLYRKVDKFTELRKAHTEGRAIMYKSASGWWVRTLYPTWSECVEYALAPDDYVLYGEASDLMSPTKIATDNIAIRFDGVTRKPISVKILT